MKRMIQLYMKQATDLVTTLKDIILWSISRNIMIENITYKKVERAHARLKPDGFYNNQ